MSIELFRLQPIALISLLIGGLAMLMACALPAKHLTIRGESKTYEAGTIISAELRRAVSFEQMVAGLSAVRVVYIGETHNRKDHHDLQLKLIQALHAVHPSTAVAMEMFDRSYQNVLDDWSAGRLSLEEFVRRTHWYANWRFDEKLYAPILEYVKVNRLPLVALNLPFHIAGKIRVGGIEHLSAVEKGFLPKDIDTTQTSHREYAQEVFNQHRFGGRTRFEDFYLAQCVWEDGMAEAVAAHRSLRPMVVLAGNGHIQYKYGIPERVRKRTGETYRTVYPVSVGEQVDLNIADYIWVME